jgi:hypothetical protein
MSSPEEVLAQARTQLRETVLEGFVANARARGHVEATEGLAAVMAARGTPLPEEVTAALARHREVNDRQERHLREVWQRIGTADPDTMQELHKDAGAVATELREFLAERQAELHAAREQ